MHEGKCELNFSDREIHSESNIRSTTQTLKKVKDLM